MTSPPLPPASDTVKPQPVAPVAAWWHTVLLVVIIVGFSVYQGQPRLVARAASFPTRLPIYGATLVYELLLFAYVWLLGLLPRKVSIREIIGGRWNRFADFLIDVATAFLFTIVVWVVLVACSLLLRFSGAKAAAPLFPQTWKELTGFVVLAVVAGFCEEFIFRGYLQRQFLAWTGTTWIAIALQAVIFGTAHYYQGWRGIVTITLYGALFGILAALRKSLRPGMMQHAGQDAFSGIIVFVLTKYKMMPPLGMLLR
jgi:hypothetical protein